ncbi:MAG: cupin domain-containing protein [Gammaproteobacteria bacterium]|jgi:mannose-6-phosphate isomerase-like protein (cupin superfamily)
MRRIVTGHNESGKSVITIDGPPARSIGEDVGGLFEIWNTDGTLIDTTDNQDRADSEIILSPPANGTKFRYFQINPTPEGVPWDVLQDLAAQAFDRIGAAHHRIDTSKHPAMHKTNTIDYIILLKGDVSLLLDEEEVRLEPFDTVVQRGTNHAWVNHGDEPALLIAVLIDSELKD